MFMVAYALYWSVALCSCCSYLIWHYVGTRSLTLTTPVWSRLSLGKFPPSAASSHQWHNHNTPPGWYRYVLDNVVNKILLTVIPCILSRSASWFWLYVRNSTAHNRDSPYIQPINDGIIRLYVHISPLAIFSLTTMNRWFLYRIWIRAFLRSCSSTPR